MHNRRQIMAFGLGGLALGGATITGLSRASAKDGLAEHALGGVGDLANPPQIHSQNGLLQTTLRPTLAEVLVDEQPRKLRRYNDGLPGPTLRVKPGDRMEITLENALPPNAPPLRALDTFPAFGPGDICGPVGTTHVAPHDLNTTNLHFHGMHVSPKGNSDNVFLTVEPGSAFTYEVQIPDNHPIGAFWYHPHWHGSVAAQIGTGMAGLILVEPEDYVPPGLPERQVIIQTVIGSDLAAFDDPQQFMSLQAPRIFTLNGQFRPTIRLRQGERQFWRILLANDFQFCPLNFADMGLRAILIGRDGIPLPAPKEVDRLLLSPGNRFDVVVEGAQPGLHDMVRQPYRHGLVDLEERIIAQVQIEAGGMPSDLMPAPAATPPDITDAEIVRSRKVVLGEVRDPRAVFDLAFTIDGQSYDPNTWHLDPKLNTAEEWTFVNTTAYPHPMHIHINPFQVVAINGVPVPDRPWYDTCVVPAAGTLTIRTRFEDFDGDFVTHCHILPHEDAGMMMNIRITT
ncbi:multicopper oxidase family protein [Phaeobacter sp. J2-8]|uniref:multicopper oxidase family protein n=1 Tax=Phaeobacter sp. J2-8 TaxID=2931394 RepID=UPI001FD1486C|nr:multicopper oxidase family protein [Phaeobacter sp. J2-8]MCJ7872700.1 multicopper oxidase family protein [Phaeobacter sp. J2-8]